mmetsp:Transcript_36315/g.82335  ORF Transcript_36315/g.82335 Transcript_36315/m.82335 type:complete len:145 (-) Transcript_36315:69-503(-)
MPSHAALTMPDTRSLQLFQDQLLRGMWADRYIKALSEDEKTVGPLFKLLQCTNELAQAQGQRASIDKRKVGTRNVLCLCDAVCAQETHAWAQCARSAARALRSGNEPSSNCATLRANLERCTHRQTSHILQTALVPTGRDDVGL